MVVTSRAAFALFRPSSCDWLNDLSLKWPTSLMSAAVIFSPPPPVVVVPPPPAFLLPPPQPAATSASSTTGARTSGSSQYFPLMKPPPMPNKVADDAIPLGPQASRQEARTRLSSLLLTSTRR